MDTDEEAMGCCSRGWQPRTMPDWERPKAFPKRSAFLTADFADGADEYHAGVTEENYAEKPDFRM